MISASAPGKIILFGEHAVVYGQPALAAPLGDLTAQAVVTESEAGSKLSIQADDLGVGFYETPDKNPGRQIIPLLIFQGLHKVLSESRDLNDLFHTEAQSFAPTLEKLPETGLLLGVTIWNLADESVVTTEVPELKAMGANWVLAQPDDRTLERRSLPALEVEDIVQAKGVRQRLMWKKRRN